MNISVDTNVLVRAILADDPVQARAARRLLKEASTIAVPLPCLCELVWILRRGAKLTTADVAAAIRALLNTGNVAMNRPAGEAGLRLLSRFRKSGRRFCDETLRPAKDLSGGCAGVPTQLCLEAGGDFADGVIAYEGRWLGGETFVSFDRKAVSLLSQHGEAAQLLS